MIRLQRHVRTVRRLDTLVHQHLVKIKNKNFIQPPSKRYLNIIQVNIRQVNKTNKKSNCACNTKCTTIFNNSSLIH